MYMWQMHLNVLGDIVFMEAPPFPLLWFTSRVYFSSRWHHCADWEEENRVKYTAWNPSITHLKILLPDAWRIQIKCSTCLSLSITVLVPFSTVLLYHCIFQRLISGHVTTLFIFLQKLSMAMPPCHLLSAVERGRAWKGKAKAKKIQVAGKNKIHLHPKYT